MGNLILRLHLLHFDQFAYGLLEFGPRLLFIEAGLRKVISVEVSDIALKDAINVVCQSVKLVLLGHLESWVNILCYLGEQVLLILFFPSLVGHLRVVSFLFTGGDLFVILLLFLLLLNSVVLSCWFYHYFEFR